MKKSKKRKKQSHKKIQKVISLRPIVSGYYVTIHCFNCHRKFDAYQPTVSGLAFGRHTCPHCSHRIDINPEDLHSVMKDDENIKEMANVTEEATRIAENWYQENPINEILNYKNINLGEPTERELLSIITSGISKIKRGGEEAAK